MPTTPTPGPTSPVGGSPRRATRERHEQELSLVRSGTDRVEDIAEALGVSTSTVRRDLAHLAATGRLARTYGGAAAGPFRELALKERMARHTEAKALIGLAAAELVPADGGTIFIDAGSTCAALAQHLVDRTDLTVITRGLEIAVMLASSPGLTVVLVGGQVAPASHGLVGRLVRDALARYRPDCAFLGADAVHPIDGIGEPTLEEASTKELAAERSRRVVVLADAEKLDREGVPVWAALPERWSLVTDERDPRRLEPFRAAGVHVISA